MKKIKDNYEKGWQAICKPLRIEYSAGDLGPAKFNVQGSMVIRTDFTITNVYGRKLACSFFEHSTSQVPLPCVIYCHANGSCRLEALAYKQMILANKFHYFCFDFTACGSSEGEYGSIGHFEQDDLDVVLKHVRETGKVTKIALWGRSMGAVTSIMYCSKMNNPVDCIVLDSPYANFKRLVNELAKNRANVPGFATSMVLGMLRKTVKKKAKFDVYTLKPIEYVGNLKMPALFGAPKDDTFVSPQHTKDLYMTHSGPKQLGIFEGDHNSQRPLEWIQRVIEFLKVQLVEEKKVVNTQPFAGQTILSHQEQQYEHNAKVQQQNLQSQYGQSNFAGTSSPLYNQDHRITGPSLVHDNFNNGPTMQGVRQSLHQDFEHKVQAHRPGGDNDSIRDMRDSGFGGHSQDYSQNKREYSPSKYQEQAHNVHQQDYGQNKPRGYSPSRYQEQAQNIHQDYDRQQHYVQDKYQDNHAQDRYQDHVQDRYQDYGQNRHQEYAQNGHQDYSQVNQGYGNTSTYEYRQAQSYGFNSGKQFVPINTESTYMRPQDNNYPGRI